MRALVGIAAVAAGVGVLTVAGSARALGPGRFDAGLEGYQEVPSISTLGTGEFSARVVGEGSDTTIEYELSYRDLTSAVTAAHVHFAQRGVNGAVSAFLCGGGDKPACPAEGTVTGTIDAADVVGPAARGIAPGEIEELVRAMEAGFTYANVHSTEFQDGEIRGQIARHVEPDPQGPPQKSGSPSSDPG
jgi:hypothetical protein